MDFTKNLEAAIKEDNTSTVDDLDAEIEGLLSAISTKDLSKASPDELKRDRDTLLDMRSKLNPYGRTIDGKTRYLCASVLNIRDDYMLRYTLTGIIGYLNRSLDEWRVPENVPAVPIYDFFKDASTLNPPQMANGRQLDPKIEAAYAESREFMKQRMIVKQFLEDTLLYNPDEHVRSAYTPNPADPERKPIGTAAAQLAVYQRRAELQRQKKKDLQAIHTSDRMVEYIDRVLYAAEDEDYRNKLTELRLERLAKMEELRTDMETLMKEDKYHATKVVKGRKNAQQEIAIEREYTQEEQNERFRTLQEMCVLLGKMAGDINDIESRIAGVDEWWEHRKKKAAAAAEAAAEANIDIKINTETKGETVIIDGIPVPKQPDDVMTKIREFQNKRKHEINNSAYDDDDEKKSTPPAHSDIPLQNGSSVPGDKILVDLKPVEPGKLPDPYIVMPAAHVLPVSIEEQAADAKQIVSGHTLEQSSGVDNRLATTVRSFIPGVDIFNKLDRYMNQNFDVLRDAVLDLYAMKSDIEQAVNPYEILPTEEKAEEYVYKHRNDVIAPIITFTTNKWNIMGSFKSNRERIRFYNENTTVLEAMADEVKRGSELGRDMVHKKRYKKRRQNKIEVGGDDEKFKEYQKMNNPDAVTADTIDDPDRPDDSITVPVITISGGGRTLKRDKFYTKAEAPSFMQGRDDTVQKKTTGRDDT